MACACPALRTTNTSPEATGVIAGTMFLICVVILQLFFARDSTDKVRNGERLNQPPTGDESLRVLGFRCRVNAKTCSAGTSCNLCLRQRHSLPFFAAYQYRCALNRRFGLGRPTRGPSQAECWEWTFFEYIWFCSFSTHRQMTIAFWSKFAAAFSLRALSSSCRRLHRRRAAYRHGHGADGGLSVGAAVDLLHDLSGLHG